MHVFAGLGQCVQKAMRFHVVRRLPLPDRALVQLRGSTLTKDALRRLL